MNWKWCLLLPALAGRAASPAEQWEKALEIGTPAFRHEGTITHVQPLDDEALLTTAQSGEVVVWDARTGVERARLPADALGGSAWHALPLPGANGVAVAGASQVAVWTPGQAGVRTLMDGKPTYFRLAFSPDGKRLAAGTGSEQVRMIDWVQGGVTNVIGLGADAYTVQFHGADRLLVGTSRGALQAHKTTGWADLGRVPAEAEAAGEEKPAVAQALRNALPGRLARSGKPVKVEPLQDFQMKDKVKTLAPAPGGKAWAACGGGGELRLLTAGPEGLREGWIAELPAEIHNAAWAPDGSWIAAPCEDQKLHRVEAADGKALEFARLPGGAPWAVAFSRDGATLYAGAGSMLCAFDVASRKRTFPAEDEPLFGAISDVDLLADGEHALVTHGKNIDVVRLSDGKAERELGRDLESPHARLLPGGQVLVVRSDAKAYLLDASAARVEREWGPMGDFLDSLPGWLPGASRPPVFVQKRPVTPAYRDAWTLRPDGGALALVRQGMLLVADLASGEMTLGTNVGHAVRAVLFRPGPRPDLVIARAESVLVLPAPATPPAAGDAAAWRRAHDDLGAASAAVRREAARVLDAGGLPALRFLQNLPESDDPEVAENTAEVIARISARHTPSTRAVDNPIRALDLEPGCLAFHPSGEWLAAAGAPARGGVRFFTLDDGKLTEAGFLPTEKRVVKLAFDPAGNTMLLLHANGQMSVYRRKA